MDESVPAAYFLLCMRRSSSSLTLLTTNCTEMSHGQKVSVCASEKYFEGCSRPCPGTGRSLPGTSMGQGHRPGQPRSSPTRQFKESLLCARRDARVCVRRGCAYLEEPVGHQEARLLVRPIPNLDVLGSTLGTKEKMVRFTKSPVSSESGHGKSISHSTYRFQVRNLGS